MKTKTPSAKHTPGPWKVKFVEYRNGFNMRMGTHVEIWPEDQGNFPPIAKCRVSDDGGANAIANAALIAAAPDLLEAVKEAKEDIQDLCTRLEDMGSDTGDYILIIDKLETLISKCEVK